MKKNKTKELILEQLRKVPLVQIACEKIGIARASFYRWKWQDKEFTKAVDEAILEGEMLINDLSETQLINLIRNQNFPSIQLWLRTHHKKYSPKVEVTGNLNIKEEPLTPEQEELVEKALGLAGLLETEQTQQNHEENTSEPTGENKS